MSASSPSHPGISLSAGLSDSNEYAEETLFGFWVFLMSDAVLFGVVFATYAVMEHGRAGGPGPKDLFDIRSVFIETGALLLSSFTYGMASLSLKYETRPRPLVLWLLVTLSLGLAFLGFEIHDLISMFQRGGSPERSGFASAFFSLVPLHGLHVTSGCIWTVAILGQMARYGIDGRVKLGLMRLGLFWHFLDIVWVAIFSVVYLGGLA